MRIWNHKNSHVEEFKCEKCKGICKGSKYIYMKNNIVIYNRNVSTEKNEQIKYMEIYVEKYL